jgi:hypothetical protein
MNKLLLSFALLAISLLSSCGDGTDPELARLEIHVTEGGQVPEFYTLKVYRGEELVKSDEFDQSHSRRNVTEIKNALPGPYYLEAESGDLWVRDTIAVYSSSRKVVNVELTK